MSTLSPPVVGEMIDIKKERKRKRPRWLSWMSGGKNDSQEILEEISALVAETSVLPSFEDELADAEGALLELKSKDLFADLAPEAEKHVKAARQAYDLSLKEHARDNLLSVKKLKERMEIILYMEELKKVGILLQDGEFVLEEIKGSDAIRDALFYFQREDAWLHQSLVTLAICIDIAKKFPELSARSTIARIKDGLCMNAVVYIRGKAYIARHPGFRFSMKVQKDSETNYMTATASSGAQYVFSREGLGPFALLQKESTERFVIPSIIEGLGPRSNAYRAASLASGLGMRDLIYEIASECIRQKIHHTFRKQGLEGRFLSRAEQKELESGLYLVSEIKGKHIPIPVEVLDWLHRIRYLPLISFTPDVFMKTEPDALLRYKAAKSDLVYYRGSYSTEVLRKTKYEITCFIQIGPWMYELCFPRISKEDRRLLVEALNYASSYGANHHMHDEMIQQMRVESETGDEWEYFWKE